MGFPGLGGGGLNVPMSKGGMGIGGLILIVILIFVLPRCLGSNGFDVNSGFDQFRPGPTGEPLPSDDTLAQFSAYVLNDVQNYWSTVFRDAGRTYHDSTLVLFTDSTSSGCGRASAATGPFYCPADQKVYLDLGFFKELQRRFGAPGDFAQAYVIAHEIGHHVQDELNISDQVHQQSQADPSQANELSVRLELQADCLAGVWAHSVYERGDLDPGDVDEGLNAAAAVGDDRVAPGAGKDSWTHGSAAQRATWFRAGFQGGDISACDTFSGEI